MPVASRALISSYLFLLAAAVCEMTIPGVLWQPSPGWFRAAVCVLLAAGILGSLIRNRAIRAIGWTGIVLLAGFQVILGGLLIIVGVGFVLVQLANRSGQAIPDVCADSAAEQIQTGALPGAGAAHGWHLG